MQVTSAEPEATRRHRPWSFLIVVAVPVLIFAVGEGLTRFGPSDGPEGAHGGAYEGLCAAHASALSGDLDDAEKSFHDTAHEPLHELSKDAQEQDRAAAARLLEAKELVESGFEHGKPAIAADVESLLAATREAIGATGEPKPAPCRSEETR